MRKMDFFKEDLEATEIVDIFNHKEISTLIKFGENLLEEVKALLRLRLNHAKGVSNEEVISDIAKIEKNIEKLVTALSMVEKFTVEIYKDKQLFFHQN